MPRSSPRPAKKAAAVKAEADDERTPAGDPNRLDVEHERRRRRGRRVHGDRATAFHGERSAARRRVRLPPSDPKARRPLIRHGHLRRDEPERLGAGARARPKPYTDPAAVKQMRRSGDCDGVGRLQVHRADVDREVGRRGAPARKSRRPRSPFDRGHASVHATAASAIRSDATPRRGSAPSSRVVAHAPHDPGARHAGGAGGVLNRTGTFASSGVTSRLGHR